MELTATERGRGHQLRDDFDESLWVQVRDFVFTQQHWDCAAREAASIAALMELSPRSRILDMPSGPGRHAIAFSALGHRVTGVDRCASYLNEACRRADAANCPVEWVCGDMRHFTSAEKFDAAVNLYTSFGYFADPADDILVLRTVQACLKNGGRFMLDLTSREILTRKDRLRERRLQFVGGHYAERSHLSDDACWLFKDVEIVRNEQRQTFQWGRRIYSLDELLEMLSAVGFASIRTCSNFHGTPFDRNAERLVLLARAD
jgi:SAM-dependent methyltransferase